MLWRGAEELNAEFPMKYHTGVDSLSNRILFHKFRKSEELMSR
jgi:hypothetical protein